VAAAMAEADPLLALSRAAGIQLSKRTVEVTPSPVDALVPDSEATSSTAPVRRKAKLTEVARILAAPGDSDFLSPPEPVPTTISPPAFTVSVPAGQILQPEPAPLSPAAVTVAEEPKVVEPASFPVPPLEAPLVEKTSPDGAAAPLVKASEKKEFLLTNGERLLGRVLSETPEVIYLEHTTLGVLTLPRPQIANRPVEIILINGDRIVGDIMAETADTLYVRHASLGMLTIPRSQQSARVVEVILKDGDRIVGEALAETEAFTVIRSATLGTVAVPHHQVAQLNRKLEQMTLKTLPPVLGDKLAS